MFNTLSTDGPRRCRECRCTGTCQHLDGTACWWVEEDLCSRCAEKLAQRRTDSALGLLAIVALVIILVGGAAYIVTWSLTHG